MNVIMNAKAAKALRRLAGAGASYQNAKRAWNHRPRDQRSLQLVRDFTLVGKVLPRSRRA